MGCYEPEACIAALLACLAPCGQARFDVHAWARPQASLVLTDIAAAAEAPDWVIRPPDTDVPAAPPPQRGRYQDEVQAAAAEYAVDGDLIHAVIATESNYVSDVVSPRGAVGLMQLMPPTARRYGIANSFDALQNIRGGAQHLRHLLSAFNGNIDLVLAAYNAGEAAVLRHGGKVPPFPETIRYVKVVRAIYRSRKKIASTAAAAP